MKELPVIQTGLEEYVSFCGIREIVLDPSATDIIGTVVKRLKLYKELIANVI